MPTIDPVRSFQRKFTPFGSKIEVPQQRHEQLAQLPENLHRLWREFGFSGFNEGRVWLTDPVEWAPVVDAWLDGVDLAMGDDRWHVVSRTAFGTLELWGERTGPSLSILPQTGQLIPSDFSERMAEPDGPNRLVGSFTVGLTPERAEAYDTDGKPLFDRAVAKLGPVSASTMYTYRPVPALGGTQTIESLIVEEAIPHLLLLRQLHDADVTADVVQAFDRRDADR